MELRIRIGPEGEPWKAELRLGFPQQRDGQRRQIFRQIDRRANLYRERVWDPATGEVWHEQEHPLRQHLGHGDDHSQPPR
jgi:hypothetical protein